MAPTVKDDVSDAGDAAVSTGGRKHYPVFPGIRGRQRSTAECRSLSAIPVLAISSRTVSGRDLGHGVLSIFRL
jgi:hypothetical protein